jgi:hypothetical protein
MRSVIVMGQIGDNEIELNGIPGYDEAMDGVEGDYNCPEVLSAWQQQNALARPRLRRTVDFRPNDGHLGALLFT